MGADVLLPRLRALVVDDSPLNRQSIVEILTASGEVEIVGEAGDGEEALQLLVKHKPDVVTLDLEMPRMDGFTLLRIAMARQPTPVVVISTHSDKTMVFRALELGAIDFVEKPEGGFSRSAAARREVLAKVLMARSLGQMRAPRTSTSQNTRAVVVPKVSARPSTPARRTPRYVFAIAASTGGPAAITDIITRLPGNSRGCLLVAQHMPERFTRAFAERLDGRGALRIVEAHDGALAFASMGFVCPGGRCMEVELPSTGPGLRVRVLPPAPTERYVPSADRLFRSVAQVAGKHAVGVVLTGMGDDGLKGAEAIRAVGGVVVAESETTAVVHGMPGAVIRAGLASKVLPLGEIAEFLASLT